MIMKNIVDLYTFIAIIMIRLQRIILQTKWIIELGGIQYSFTCKYWQRAAENRAPHSPVAC